MGFRIRPAVDGRKLTEQLTAGDLDALVSTAVIDHPAAQRLFPDYREIERDYYTRTGILPIGHVVAIRREVSDTEPAAAALLGRAWEESKRLARAYDEHPNASDLVWFSIYRQQESQLLGDAFPFGIEENRTALGAFLTYAHEQGLTAQRRGLERLFV
jgi:4,5-dihydroxyphthalate decarboxylase